MRRPENKSPVYLIRESCAGPPRVSARSAGGGGGGTAGATRDDNTEFSPLCLSTVGLQNSLLLVDSHPIRSSPNASVKKIDVTLQTLFFFLLEK